MSQLSMAPSARRKATSEASIHTTGVVFATLGTDRRV